MKVLCKKDFYYPQPEKPIHDLSFLVFKEGEYYNCTEENNQYFINGLSKTFQFLTYSPDTRDECKTFHMVGIGGKVKLSNRIWYFEDYFYTQKEVRKFKLNKIKNEKTIPQTTLL